jgi:hypothetical protein
MSVRSDQYSNTLSEITERPYEGRGAFRADAPMRQCTAAGAPTMRGAKNASSAVKFCEGRLPDPKGIIVAPRRMCNEWWARRDVVSVPGSIPASLGQGSDHSLSMTAPPVAASFIHS